MKAIKEDQAFSFVTHTFALTGEEDYLMFKNLQLGFYQQSPSSTFLHSHLQHSIFWAVFRQFDIFGQFSAV